MNEIINKLLLAGDQFMPEMHLRLSRFKYSPCGPFTENRERISRSKWEIHDMAYGDFKDLNRRTAADKVLCDK